ncbi:hypothetical protein Ddye_028219, partial [Dipteronia dyeriana]
MKEGFTELNTRMGVLELSVDSIRGTTVLAARPSTPIIDPRYSHHDIGFAAINHGIRSRQHDGADPGGYDTKILPSD